MVKDNIKSNVANNASIDIMELDKSLEKILSFSVSDLAKYAIEKNMPALLYYTLSSNPSKYLGRFIIDRYLMKYAILDIKVNAECKFPLSQIEHKFQKQENNQTQRQKTSELIDQCDSKLQIIKNEDLLKYSPQLAVSNDNDQHNALLPYSTDNRIKQNNYYFTDSLTQEKIAAGLELQDRNVDLKNNVKYKEEKIDKDNKRLKENLEKPNYDVTKDIENIEKSLILYDKQKNQIIESLVKINDGRWEGELNQSLLPFAMFEIVIKASNIDILSKIELIEINKKQMKETAQIVGKVIVGLTVLVGISAAIVLAFPVAPALALAAKIAVAGGAGIAGASSAIIMPKITEENASIIRQTLENDNIEQSDINYVNNAINNSKAQMFQDKANNINYATGLIDIGAQTANIGINAELILQNWLININQKKMLDWGQKLIEWGKSYKPELVNFLHYPQMN